MTIEIIICIIIGWLISYFLPAKETLRNFYVKLFKGAIQITGINKKIEKELDKAMKSTEQSLKMPEFEDNSTLPESGYPKDKILSILRKYSTHDEERNKTKHISGAFYNGSQERLEITSEATKLFVLSNPLHADDCKSVRKMEAEVIRMTANLLNAPGDSAGILTTGGTESIILSVRSHYQNAIKNKGFNPLNCELILCENAHPAWLKGCELMHIKPIMIPMNKEYRLDPIDVEKHINLNTILIVTGAPSYPHGIIDDIESICQIAKSHNVPVHVDACLGGFLDVFTNEAGFNIPKFDFTVDGVMSISCDTHKYGYAPKGSSVLIFRNHSLRDIVFFRYPKWIGGVYCSPSIPGSRAGMTIAGAWSAIMFTGKEGYIKATKDILTTAKNIKEEINKWDEIKLISHLNQDTSVVAFTTKNINIYKVSDCMNKEFGYELNAVQFPSAVHFCITEKTAGCENDFLNALKKSIEIVKKDPNNPKYNVWAPIYGMTANVPDDDLLEDMVANVIALYCDVI